MSHGKLFWSKDDHLLLHQTSQALKHPVRSLHSISPPMNFQDILPGLLTSLVHTPTQFLTEIVMNL